jgi:hypothetical protein
MTTYRFSEHDIRQLKIIEFSVLSSLTMTDLYTTPKTTLAFEMYRAQLLHVASVCTSKAPQKWSDAEVERDYLKMRVLLHYNIDPKLFKREGSDGDAEYDRRLGILNEFLKSLKVSPKL